MEFQLKIMMPKSMEKKDFHVIFAMKIQFLKIKLKKILY
jgi:hypothetical protein